MGRASSPGRLPIAAKLNVVLFAASSLVCVLTWAILTRWLDAVIESRALAELERSNRQAVDMIDAYAAMLEQSARMFGGLFAKSLPAELTLDLERTEPVGAVPLPVILGHGVPLNNDLRIVDAFTEATGATATVFVRKGDDFYRVTTSVKQEDGERALGTALGKAHPGYRFLMSGKPYTGRAMLFGHQYMTHYQPLFDAKRHMIGIAYVGIDFTESLATLRKKVSAIQIEHSGYIYVLDAWREPGKVVIHPRGLEGHNILGALDRDGRPFVREMLAMQHGMLRYAWQTPEGNAAEAREKIGVVDRFERWGWVIVSVAYMDDLAADLRALERQLTIAGLAALGLLLASLFISTNYWIRRPLEELVRATERVAAHDATGELEATSRGDEIGQLARAFADMAKRVVDNTSNLERLVTDRTRELVEAKNQAEAANRAKSMFLANMSHEIRTPMNGVLGMTALLVDTDLSPEQRELASTVKSSADSLLSIINDILDFSKIEAGKMDVEVVDFDLRVLIDDTTDLLAPRAREKGLEFISLVEPDVPTRLRGDPTRLRQVITNLLGNAVKFTERGEVALWVDAMPSETRGAEPSETSPKSGPRRGPSGEDPKPRLRFRVRDTGIGIPADKVAALFAPFTQVDASTTRRFGGTGLGLSIAKRLVELMGGSLEVESTEGAGSTFTFTLPFEVGSATWELTDTHGRTSLAGRRILVVDDTAMNRRLMELLLLRWKCEPLLAASSDDALRVAQREIAEGRRLDAIVLDMQMPSLGGDTLGATLRQEPAFAATPLIMLSSVAVGNDAEKLAKVGFDAYLTKPIREARLQRCLETVLGMAREHRAPHERHEILTDDIIPDSGRARILVVEDNPVNQRVALHLISKQGYRTDLAVNGRQALLALAHTRYAAVLMDCQMPELDGYEATEIIRAGGHDVLDPKVPIIAMTANAMQGDRERALASGMDDYLTKPIKPAQLTETLRRWVKTATPPVEQRPDERPLQT